MPTRARKLTPIPATTFASDFARGLRERPKRVSSKYFYDDAGSALFDRICDLDEYYLTRTELGIMKKYAVKIAERVGAGLRVVELGSGSGNKTRALLDTLTLPLEYMPIDVSPTPLEASARSLKETHPALKIMPVSADFTAPFVVPQPGHLVRRTLVYFPGSTIGNLTPSEAIALLNNVRTACGKCFMVLGVDLKKDPARLHAAYNDSLGVTAAFNKNLLARANRELGADFDLDAFAHYAFYAPVLGRIEMHLVSLARQTVHFGAQASETQSFEFEQGETLVTEYSHKYTMVEMERLAHAGGFRVLQWHTDEKQDFAVGLLEA
jgi:dimethylhistidine N-methyltransferase